MQSQEYEKGRSLHKICWTHNEEIVLKQVQMAVLLSYRSDQHHWDQGYYTILHFSSVDELGI